MARAILSERVTVVHSLWVAILVLALLVSPAAWPASSPLYTGPARTLVPSPSEIGFESLTAQSARPLIAPSRGLRSSWQASLARPEGSGSPSFATVGVLVFKTEEQALARFKAWCPSCVVQISRAGRFKGGEPTTDPSGQAVVIGVGQCVNVVAVATTAPRRTTTGQAGWARSLLSWSIDKALASGMRGCGKTTPVSSGAFARASGTAPGFGPDAKVVAVGTVSNPTRIIAKFAVSLGARVDVDALVACVQNGLSQTAVTQGYVNAPARIALKMPPGKQSKCSVTLTAILHHRLSDNTLTVELIRNV